MVEAGWARRLYVFAKAPLMGRAKTRLAKDIGGGAAMNFYRRESARVLKGLGQDKRWRTILAYDRPEALGFARPPALPAAPQGAGDLGARMGRVFASAPPGPVVIIGGDIPGVSPGHIAAAFRKLMSADAVVGPAPDGGYWLIGLKRIKERPGLFASQVFQGVRWSSSYALRDTLAGMPESLRVERLGVLQDVDTQADYKDYIHAGPVSRMRGR
ncbi:MAG: TIGR04282 family arsenosugar biosynthesis glycosyltransferase [Pseudomonadota bacterium]